MYKWLRRFVDPYCPPDKVGTGHLPLVKGEKESGVSEGSPLTEPSACGKEIHRLWRGRLLSLILLFGL